MMNHRWSIILYSRLTVSSVSAVPLPSDVDPHLAAVVRALRERQGSSQERVAHEAGVTVQTLARIERGEANPTWATVRRVASSLGVTIGVLARAVDDEERGG
jgi:DNA-binding XRE family transcriptional regulator